LRTRAAYRPGLSGSDLAARRAMMMMQNTNTAEAPVWAPITAADMTQDFIMTERTRELFGENVRWPDLACRGLLVSRVQTYNALRPIPQTQLDAITDPNKTQYQNPGY